MTRILTGDLGGLRNGNLENWYVWFCCETVLVFLCHIGEPPKSVDSDYNSSNELPSPESSKSQKRVERHDLIPSGTSLDTSSLEISGSPISAEQVALCLLEKVASRKNLTSADLKWMVSEHDVPQSLLPLPTAIPVSPDDELYDTTEHFDRRTSLPVSNGCLWYAILHGRSRVGSL